MLPTEGQAKWKTENIGRGLYVAIDCHRNDDVLQVSLNIQQVIICNTNTHYYFDLSKNESFIRNN